MRIKLKMKTLKVKADMMQVSGGKILLKVVDNFGHILIKNFIPQETVKIAQDYMSSLNNCQRLDPMSELNYVCRKSPKSNR